MRPLAGQREIAKNHFHYIAKDERKKKLIVLCNCCNELLSWGSRARLCGGSPADVDKQIMKIDIYIPLSDSYAK